MAVKGYTGLIEQDRVNAERWISRFGGAVESDDGTSMETGEDSVIIRPVRQDADSPYVLYIHGGGMVYYSTANFQPFLRVLANTLRAPVEAVEYLKAPEHSVEQSVDRLGRHLAVRCRTVTDRPLVIAGDSVGGLLALYLSVRALPPVFSRIVLIYPILDLHTERASYQAFGEGYFLDSEAMRLFRSILNPFFSQRDFDPFALSRSDLARLPACSIVTSGCDVLRDEGLAWVAYLADHGVAVRHQHFPDLPHDFCLYAGRVGSARRAVAEIATHFR